jgi:hypothetical protein
MKCILNCRGLVGTPARAPRRDRCPHRPQLQKRSDNSECTPATWLIIIVDNFVNKRLKTNAKKIWKNVFAKCIFSVQIEKRKSVKRWKFFSRKHRASYTADYEQSKEVVKQNLMLFFCSSCSTFKIDLP